MKRRFSTAALAIAASVMSVVPAVAAPPETLPGEPFLDETCGFPIEVVVTGKMKVIEHGDRTIYIAPQQKVTLTNPVTGETATYVITGSFHDRVQADGSIITMAVGKNVLFGPGIEGLLLTTGRVVVTTTNPEDPDNFVLTINSARGRVINLCDVLA